MSPDAIRAESVSKDYRLGVDDTALARLGSRKSRERLIHQALRDVSFSVTPGEVVGVIGRNGAGKSTLLKILSRITRPTSGRISITGRVGSLLEVGTGFHPELTGKENIYLNGTILGMRRREVARHFDDIVEFSGVESFLDTPVKRYSSGMYVRLAFAVAAHLDTEVLLVDEVLAVGDAEFQAKCMGRMRDVSSEGRTVLFVSHNHVAVEALCPRSIYLEGGIVAVDGTTREALVAYAGTRAAVSSTTPGVTQLPAVDPLDGAPILEELTMASGGRQTSHFLVGEPATFTVTGLDLDLTTMVVGMRITSPLGEPLLGVNTAQRPARTMDQRPASVTFGFDRLPLTPGSYRVDLAVTKPAGDEPLVTLDSIAEFFVEPADVFGTGYPVTRTDGPILPDHHWHT